MKLFTQDFGAFGVGQRFSRRRGPVLLHQVAQLESARAVNEILQTRLAQLEGRRQLNRHASILPRRIVVCPPISGRFAVNRADVESLPSPQTPLPPTARAFPNDDLSPSPASHRGVCEA